MIVCAYGVQSRLVSVQKMRHPLVFVLFVVCIIQTVVQSRSLPELGNAPNSDIGDEAEKKIEKRHLAIGLGVIGGGFGGIYGGGGYPSPYYYPESYPSYYGGYPEENHYHQHYHNYYPQPHPQPYYSSGSYYGGGSYHYGSYGGGHFGGFY